LQQAKENKSYVTAEYLKKKGTRRHTLQRLANHRSTKSQNSHTIRNTEMAQLLEQKTAQQAFLFHVAPYYFQLKRKKNHKGLSILQCLIGLMLRRHRTSNNPTKTKNRQSLTAKHTLNLVRTFQNTVCYNKLNGHNIF
jgi:hypothetical protein